MALAAGVVAEIIDAAGAIDEGGFRVAGQIEVDAIPVVTAPLSKLVDWVRAREGARQVEAVTGLFIAQDGTLQISLGEGEGRVQRELRGDGNRHNAHQCDHSAPAFPQHWPAR